MSRSSGLDGIRPLLIFLGLFGLGLTLPLLDLYGENPEIFIANRSSTTQIVAFGLIVALAPAAIMAGVCWLCSVMNRRAGEIFEMMAIAIAGFFVVSSLLRYVMALTDVSLAIAILAAVLLGFYGRRQGFLRDWLTYLIIIPIFSLVSFFMFSDSAGLLWEQDAEAESNTSIGNPLPIVMLIMDEFPVASLLTEDGKINDSLFPNFERVANASHWFRNFATNSIATTDSVPIILSGIIHEGAKPTSSDHPNTLFTLLGESYTMYVGESVTSLCPDSICRPERSGDAQADPIERTDGSLRLLLDDAQIVYGHLAMPPLVRTRLSSIEGRWGNFRSSDENSGAIDHRIAGLALPPVPKGGRPSWINKFIAAIDQFATSESQSLHYTHLMAPHIPWKVNPSGTVYKIPEQTNTLVTGVQNGYWVKTSAIPTQGYQRYLSQLGSIDLLLGHYLDELQRTGLWEEALVIITADHGASFRPGSHRRWVNGDNADSLYRVPFFIHLPGQDFGVTRDEPTFSIDILPTIIDVLDSRVAWPLEGLSLLGELPPVRTHVYDHFTGKQLALDMRLDDLWKEVAQGFTLIPDTRDWESIAAVGPYREMVGKPLKELAVVVNGGIIASFDGFEDDVIINTKSGIVPTVLKGRVSIPAGYITANVLIAVNGSVRGAGYAIRDNGDTFIFSAYVPESAFKQGRNKVELVVASEAGQWHHSITGSVAKTSLRDMNGNLLKIVPRGQRLVRIDAVEFENGMLRVRGWSADTKDKILPDTIYIFYGDKIAYSGPPNVKRKDVTIWFKADHLSLSGFDFRLPADRVPANLERVTIVASFPGNAVLDYATLHR